jgi:hypothetical protein
VLTKLAQPQRRAHPDKAAIKRLDLKNMMSLIKPYVSTNAPRRVKMVGTGRFELRPSEGFSLVYRFRRVLKLATMCHIITVYLSLR